MFNISIFSINVQQEMIFLDNFSLRMSTFIKTSQSVILTAWFILKHNKIFNTKTAM